MAAPAEAQGWGEWEGMVRREVVASTEAKAAVAAQSRAGSEA